MNNTILSTQLKQVRKPIRFKPLSEALMNDPSIYFKKMSSATRCILDYIFALSNNYQDIFPSQSTLANAAAVTRQTANEIVGRLYNDGILGKEYRHMGTSLYKINPTLLTLDFRKILATIFSNISIMPLSLLMILNNFSIAGQRIANF